MRTTTALAIGLSLAQQSAARVTNPQRRESDQKSSNLIANAFNKLLGRAPAAQIACFRDEYFAFAASESGPALCQNLFDYPNTTVTVTETQARSTVGSLSTTVWRTETSVVTVPAATATVTIGIGAGVSRREASDAEARRFLASVKRLTDADVPDYDRAAFASACACLEYTGSTITATATATPEVLTRTGFQLTSTTILSTVTAGTTTITISTSLPTPSAGSSTSTSSDEETSVTSSSATTSSSTSAATATTTLPVETDEPAPIAAAFTCPNDDGQTVSQLVGNERFDYRIACDTDISNEDLYSRLAFTSLSECAASCSIANRKFDWPVCQGASYYEVSAESGFNCFLKSSANSTVAAPGFDSAILLRIAVGLSEEAAAGTNTESVPLAGETISLSPSDASSSLSVIFANRSTAVSVVTPPAIVARAGETTYSTLISQGGTSTWATVFSTYWSSNGVWFFSYFTAYSQSWAAATTVYGVSETSVPVISNSSNSDTIEVAGPNGQYYTVITTNSTTYFPGGYNITQVIANQTFASNGTEVFATTTTLYFSYETGGAGSNGAISAGVSAGLITSSGTVVSTQYVISTGGVVSGIIEGGGSGGEASGAISTPAPSFSVVTNTYAAGFSSGLAASGGGFGNGSSSGTMLSGFLPTTVTSLVPISSTVNEGGSAGASSTAASGLIPSNITSIVPPPIVVSTDFGGPLTSAVPISSTVSESGSAFSSGTEGSGLIPSSPITTASTASVESASSSGGVPFTNSNGDRTPGALTSSVRSTGGSTYVASSAGGYGNFTGSFASGTAPSSTAPISTPSSTASTGSSTESSDTSSSTGSVPFSLQTDSRTRVPDASTTSSRDITYTESIPWATDLTAYLPPPPYTNTNPVVSRSANASSTSAAGSISTPVGTAPSSSSGFPIPSGNSSSTISVPFSAPTDSRTRNPFSSTATPSFSGTAPGSTGFLHSSSVPFNISSASRSGTLPPSGTAPTASSPFFPSGTAPTSRPPFLTGTAVTSPPFPTGTGPSSCVTNFLGTATIFTTVTEYGCYANCPPAGYGGYGTDSPNTFGPPARR